MNCCKKKTYENFNETNIASIKRLIQSDLRDNTHDKRTFTMLETSTHHPVVVTQSSRQKCANMLLQ